MKLSEEYKVGDLITIFHTGAVVKDAYTGVVLRITVSGRVSVKFSTVPGGRQVTMAFTSTGKEVGSGPYSYHYLLSKQEAAIELPRVLKSMKKERHRRSFYAALRTLENLRIERSDPEGITALANQIINAVRDYNAVEDQE